MSDTLNVTGSLDGITEKASGWFEIAVAVPGKQYPVKLATKKQELVELARAAGQNVMTWTYTERESDKINPHTNAPFVNRYFEGVAPIGEGMSVSSTTGEVRPTNAPGFVPSRNDSGMSKEEWARKDSAIHKMACIKTAADALKHTVPDDPSTEDLNTYMARVSHLALGWHRSVIAERDDPTGEDIPF